MVAQTRHGGQASPKKKLAFHEKLLGKGLSTDALLKKMKALHTELAALDQEHVDVGSLGAVRKELVNTSILLHKDRGVKAYAACCLADILRLYAPDAPYTQAELRDIFQFFFRQLTNGLKGTESSYYNEYFHLLESLSTVKSVVLVCDLPTAEEIMAEIFRDFFNLVRRDLAKKIEMFMVDILVALIDECQVLPSEVLDTILSQFMDNNTRIEQAGYRLAVQVCNQTVDKLQRHVCQHFTDIIVENSGDEDFNEIRTAHELIKRVHRSCPGLLQSIIPQLEEELRVEDQTLRLIVTQTLGEMFGDKGGVDLVKKFPTTWNVWILRKNDKSAAIRLKFVETARILIANLPEQRETIEESLNSKFFDPDEKVRAAACRVYGQLDYETALHHVSEDQLHALAGRGLDKKHSVRLEALTSLGKLYNLAYPEIENNEPLAIKQFSWIPNEMLLMLSISPDVRLVLEQVVLEHILPLPSSSTPSSSKGGEIDEVAWTDKLLNTMKHLEERSTNAILLLSGLKTVRPSVFDHFLEVCIKNNGGIIDENEELITHRLNGIIQFIAASFSDPHKAGEDLHAFAKLNENRLYKLLRTCMDQQTDLKALVKAANEFNRRVEQSSASIAATMTALLRRCSPWILNQSSIPTLIKRVQKGHGNATSQSHATAAHAETLLTFVSKHSPALYKPHISELTKAIADEKNTTLVEVSLRALAGVISWDDKLAPTDKRTNERLSRLALQSNYRYAKFAARALAFSKNKDEVCAEMVESIVEGMTDCSPELLVGHIAVLAQFAKYIPDAFEHRSDVIMAFLLKKVLMVPSLPDLDEMDEDEEWQADEDVSPTTKAKILSLKVCRHRSLAHASSEKALEIVTPVLKMLATLIEHNGSLSSTVTEDPKVISRMRLQAAVSLLHLSTTEVYANAMSPKFLRLAVVVQDSCYNVRVTFLTKLISLLQPRKLPPRYNVIPFLTVHDPESDVKSMAASYISGALRKMNPAVRSEHLEIIFIRLLHLLAHHPDFNTSHDDLLDIAKYVQFYLDLIATSETVSLLYHLAMKGKTVRDAESHTYTQNLYVISELAQELIKTRAGLHSWSIQSYPGKVRLPPDILRPLPNADAANKILKTVYLPEETLSWLAEISKPSNQKEKKERKTAAKRKAAPAKPNGHSKRARVKKKWDSDDESEDETSDAESSDVSMKEPQGDPASELEQENDENREEVLGRGARTRAKARSIRQAIKQANPPTDDDE
ncbi:armadillo-type protein [Collybia nuda]|uniref:Armadillo-type protein n=1 Tax=Collybia nuda TaxID=64659 RepID=A0A9P5XVY2_9AGAR|nr:armadillo-type protein [Collybia nuda]